MRRGRMPMTSFSITSVLDAQLNAHKRVTGMSRAEIIRRALRCYLRDHSQGETNGAASQNPALSSDANDPRVGVGTLQERPH